MTTQRKFELIGALVAVLLVAVFIKGWFLERDARVKAQANADAQKQVIAAKDEAIQQRDAAVAQYNAAISKQIAGLKTPQQAAQVIVRYLPETPVVPGVPASPSQTVATVTKQDFTAAERAKLPDAPSYDVLTDTQAESVAKTELACDAQAKTLNACTQDKADLNAKYDAEVKVADGYKSAMKGGTKIQRFARVLKLMACAGAGAEVGSRVPSRSAANASAIGAAAGVTACSLF